MSSSVAVERSYIEPLSQRHLSSLHSFGMARLDLPSLSYEEKKFSPQQIKPPLDAETVTISKLEYERLICTCLHFNNLKESLLKGGVSQETLDVLIYGSIPSPESYNRNNTPSSAASTTNSRPQRPTFASRDPRDDTKKSNETAPRETPLPKPPAPQRTFSNDDSLDVDNSSSDERTDGRASLQPEQSSPAPLGQHTVVIRGFPERASYSDILEVVRGGALFQIFLRSRDRMASVSFVHSSAAQEFVNHAKRHDIYVQGKRVEISWSERQFYLPAYVKAKVDIGASRNLMICGVNPNISEVIIRRDLEHIHNLIIVDVQFSQGTAYISTNSIQNAMFARSCMMSRLMYKGMKINHYPDECAEPLPKVHSISRKDNPPPTKKVERLTNRFQMLYMDGSGDSDDDENNAVANCQFFDNNINWEKGSIAV
ncbi:hypothetical protein Egran_06638 [Elaphomyces granulatus]|uniref:RRM domain-containing protein n=1 Tax=Elaphomyces granulatus TaxID=519963 RepID=A0A232LNC0_9EURO|nr:hypothetical protein Egran_06638 [Elaphomyces granulatus]